MEFVCGTKKEILELQRLFREGKIKEEDLTSEQINELGKLYDRQIEELRISNEYRKKKLLQYREKMQKTCA